MAGRYGNLPGKPTDFGSDLTGYKYGLPKEDGGTGERYLPRDPYQMTDGELREWGVTKDRGAGPTGSELTNLQNKKAGRQLGKTAIAGSALVGEDAEGSDDFTEDYNRRYEVRQFNYGPAGQIIQKHTPQPEPSQDWVYLSQGLIAPGSKEYPMPPPPSEGEQPIREVPERGMVDRILDILNPQRDRDADLRGTIEDIVGDIARPFTESPVPEAVAQGVLVDAPNGVLSLGEELNEALGAPYITWGPEGIGFSESLPEGAEPIRVPSIMDEGTQAQEVIRGFSQFFSVFGAAGGLGKGASLLKQVKAGGIADVLFDPEYGNLSTLLRELDIDNSLTQYLDSKVGEDADAFAKLEGRAKNILEGAGLGAILPAVVAGFRAAKRADWGPAIREFLDKGTETATGGVVQEMPMETKLFGSAENPGRMRAAEEFGSFNLKEDYQKIAEDVEANTSFGVGEKSGYPSAKYTYEDGTYIKTFGRTKEDAQANLVRVVFKKRLEDSRKVSVKSAETLEEGGASRDEIWEQTGLIRGDEGVWRFEMDDSQSKFVKTEPARELIVQPKDVRIVNWMDGKQLYAWTDPANSRMVTAPVDKLSMEEAVQYIQHRAGSRAIGTGRDDAAQFMYNASWMAGRSGSQVRSPLDNVLDYPELFKIYPELRSITVRFDPNAGSGGAYYSSSDNSIGVGTDLGPEGLRDVLLHEIQHAIQDFEGLVKGGSPESAIQFVSRAKKKQRAPLIESEQRLDYHSKKLRAWSMMNHKKYWERFLTYAEPTRQARFVRNEGMWYQYSGEISDKFGPQPKRHRPKAERAEWLRNVARFYIDKIDEQINSMPNVKHYMDEIENDPRQWKSIYRAYVRELDKVSEQGWLSKKLKKEIDELYRNADDPEYAKKVYKDLSGEIEARMVQKRRNLSKEERAKTSPDVTRKEVSDIPREEAHAISHSGEVIQKGKGSK